jgi:hypothetical protein
VTRDRSDIKVAHPGEQPYAAQYGTQGLSYPLYQVRDATPPTEPFMRGTVLQTRLACPA